MAEQEDNAGWKFTTDETPEPQAGSGQPVVGGSDQTETLSQEPGDEALFKWSAPDSFSAHKSAGWYLILLGITLVVSAAVYFGTKDKISTAVVLVCGILIGVYGAKKPKAVDYQITRYGFRVNGRYYQFGSYRSFSIIRHGEAASVVLTPLKRFMPYMYINFGHEVEEQVTTALSGALPRENSNSDVIDRFLRRIGF